MKVFDSASFSVARCSRPMCGSARWITSPSSSSTRRSTPCAAGCCGPKLIVKLRSAVSAMSAHQFWCGLGLFRDLGVELIPCDDHTFVAAFSNHIHAVMRTHFEDHLAATHLNALDIDFYGKASPCCRRVANIHVGAEAAFAGCEMLIEQF